MSRITQIIEALEAERADVQQRLEWLDGQIQAFREHHEQQPAPAAPAGPPARSRRRATAKRASARRATARSVKRDVAGDIIGFLKSHPGSTAGDVAKGLNLNRNSVASRLSQLVKTGEITKAQRGYALPDAPKQ